MKCKARLESYLQDNEVAYQSQHHPTAYTAQTVAAADHVGGKSLAKVVMAMADGRLAMLVVDAPHKVNFTKVATALQAEVRLAHEEEFVDSFPDCEVGAMPPFGNLFNLPTYVDRGLAEEETIYFKAGTHTDTMSIAYADFARLVKPKVADLTAETAATRS